MRAGCIDEDDAELADQVRQQGEALDATKKVNNMNTLTEETGPRLRDPVPWLPSLSTGPRSRNLGDTFLTISERSRAPEKQLICHVCMAP